MTTNGTNGKESENRKLCIICSKGSLDMAYPPLVLANAARMSGIDVDLFFTFWGLEMICKDKMKNLKVPTVGNPSMHIPTMLGGLPGMSTVATTMMKREIEKLDFPEIDEFIEMLSDAGANLYACKMSMDMMKLTDEDIIEEAEIIGAMEFMEMSEGAQLLFI
ncbi:MAG: hypothetical protein D6737_19650 [Chloroflexi bacterium]|nr:MAG: hypothetical protein D6737_19650 [Chloroflexota bacterium]